MNQRETVADRGLEFLGLRVHRTVFPLAVALIVLAVTAALLDPAGFNASVARLRGGILQHFDSFIMIMGNLFVVLCIVLALSPLGRIRLGGPQAQPQFGFVSWFSMLFAAGMGVGLLYWGVAEPVAAYTGWPDTPLNVAPRTPAAAHAAMGSALFHWGLHPWAVYLVTALVVGYFAYNKGLPFAMSSALSPLIGLRHAGPIGQGVDTFTVVLTSQPTADVTIGARHERFVFEPDKYTGKATQVVVPGPEIDPKTSSTIVVEKGGKGFAFASATWHFSTEKLPEEDRGDFFQVSRRYFLRENTGKEWVLKPLADGAALKPGDQVEVQISLRTKHAAEYVHLRDPRGAGFEPESTVSRYKWDLGIAWYEEVRDSGTNFFFEQLPVGEYAFRYRLRANMAGTFRVGPATVQSMYAPEFNAYSSGAVLTVTGE